MQVLIHHIYEYQKGIRNLILHTLNHKYRFIAEQKLKSHQIPYLIREIDETKFNVFFGNQHCIDAIIRIGNKCLSDFTDEEDFILGIMLGYDRLKQVERYNERKSKRDSTASIRLAK
ncbi:MAG: DUF2023 family protein [Candidatus Cloacimonetes bacterium]|nr:DUF2023 family protein [Candidatus Cloacimonadota bacterium]HPM03011.1 DUF2023 family protein [Candidatus Cloacimonadota bacterium]